MNDVDPGRCLAQSVTTWLAAALIPLAGCLAVVWGLGAEPSRLAAGLALAFGSLAVLAAVLRTRRLARGLAAVRQETAALKEQAQAYGRLAAVGEQAAGVAHEINNPVAIMMEEAGWALDILDGEDFAEPGNLAEMRRALTQIRVQGARCKEINHLLLTYARKPDDALSNTDINALIEQLLALSGVRARAAKVRLTANLAPDLPQVAAPASQLQQVLLNLINNALDAMEPDGGELTIATSRAGDAVQLLVSDTGPGIAAAVMTGCSNRFSPPRPWARARAWAFPSAPASCGNSAAKSPSPPRPGAARNFSSCCRRPQRTPRPVRRLHDRRPLAPDAG